MAVGNSFLDVGESSLAPSLTGRLRVATSPAFVVVRQLQSGKSLTAKGGLSPEKLRSGLSL